MDKKKFKKCAISMAVAGIMAFTPLMAGCTAGEKGDKGDKGDTGASGATWHHGSDTPTSAVGKVGDYYFETDTGAVWHYGETGWAVISNIKGDDAVIPHVGANKNWWIGETDTGICAEGTNGVTPSIAINNDGYWVINDEITEYKASSDINDIKEKLKNSEDLVLKPINFVESYTTNRTYSMWTNTTSTFSGWGGVIGKPETISTIRFKVRARDTAITQIKVYLNKDSKTGENVYSKLLNVNIMPFEEEYVYVELPSVLDNTNNDNYWFGYECNAFCDRWGYHYESSKPEDYCDTVMAYTINGTLHQDTLSFQDCTGSFSYNTFMAVDVGTIETVYALSDAVLEKLSGKVDVNLASEYNLTVGDNFQLFYRGVVQAVNPYNYHIVTECSKGASYPRYFEWTPESTDVGTHDLKISVYDNNGNILGFNETKLVVNVPKETNETQNILCIGDSLTAGGFWVSEAYRRFACTSGTPEGLGYDYLNFVGTVTKEVDSKTVGYEGYGGWTWASFCSSSSPFWDADSEDISFKKYCENNSIEDLDVVYIMLTWNGQAGYDGEYSVDTGHFVYARRIIEKLHEEYPNITIRCMGIQMPSQNGGMGTNYGANGDYSDAYGMLKNAMAYNKTLELLCGLEEYKTYVKYVDVAGQFDTDYNMPADEKPVNNRNDEKEIVGTNGVHPSTEGYYQIADAVFRSLCEVFADTTTE